MRQIATAPVLRFAVRTDEQLVLGKVPRKEKQMSTIIVEIRAAEGGEDAKLLVGNQFRAYVKACERRHL